MYGNHMGDIKVPFIFPTTLFLEGIALVIKVKLKK